VGAQRRGVGRYGAGMAGGDLREQREALGRRLTQEFDDADVAVEIVTAVDDSVVAGLVERSDPDLATSPLLSYRPPAVPDAEVDSLWILAFGYRFAEGGADAGADGAIPPMSALEPGPVNEALAREAAAFVDRHPVPIVAQWEVARVLAELGVGEVISVEPDYDDDGSVIYLSTMGVLEKGLRLLDEAGLTAGRAGVLGHADHAGRCLMAARGAGLSAAVPEGVDLPADYDPESGQPWTRSRTNFVPVDLMVRSLTG